MGATAVLQREAIEVYDYRCSAGPGDRPFAELHDRFSVAYVRKGTFGYETRGRVFELRVKTRDGATTRLYNADGTTSELSGNGVRCVAAWLGFERNLSPGEIVDQVLAMQAIMNRRISNVVYMGMGEPMLNYDRVMKAAEVMSDPCGLAITARSITVSTAGVVPGIRRFTEEKRPYRLIVSLTSAGSAASRPPIGPDHGPCRGFVRARAW